MSEPDPPAASSRAENLIENAERKIREAAAPSASAPDDGARDRARRRLEELLEQTAALGSRERVDDVLDQILESALELTRADRAYVLQREQDDTLRVWAARGRAGDPVDPEGYTQISRTILGVVLRQGRTYFNSDAMNDPLLASARSVRDLSLRTVVCVPLRPPRRDGGEPQVLGALYVDSRSAHGVLDQEEIRLLERFGEQAAAALGQALRREELAVAAESLQAENTSLKAALGERSSFDRIKGSSAAMQPVYEILERVARNPVTVLVTGETGTGKELVARALHFNGPHAGASFVGINCAAFTPSLLESELFGFRKGSFTGADTDRVGLVESANGGTLFLDEIGEMSLDVQSKFLRVLEEREVRRLGETRSRPVTFRLIAATNRDLAREVREKRFREDLFFRINVVPVRLPPLRERGEDVWLLAGHFLEQQRIDLERPGLELSRAARQALLRHSWPGNVRELRNVIERACALASGEEIEPADFGFEAAPAASPPAAAPRGASLKDILRSAERSAVEDALRETRGVVTHAAERLGVTRQHLHNRIRRLGLDPDRFRG